MHPDAHAALGKAGAIAQVEVEHGVQAQQVLAASVGAHVGGAGADGAEVGVGAEVAGVVLECGADADSAALEERALQKGVHGVALVAGIIEFVIVQGLVETGVVAQSEEAVEGEIIAVAGRGPHVNFANGVAMPGAGRELEHAVKAALYVERVQILVARLAETLAQKRDARAGPKPVVGVVEQADAGAVGVEFELLAVVLVHAGVGAGAVVRLRAELQGSIG